MSQGDLPVAVQICCTCISVEIYICYLCLITGWSLVCLEMEETWEASSTTTVKH